jgi:hypothetical protein
MFPGYLHFPGFRAASSRFPRLRFPFSASQFPQIHKRRDQRQRRAEPGEALDAAEITTASPSPSPAMSIRPP